MDSINNYNRFDKKSINEILKRINDNHKTMLPAI